MSNDPERRVAIVTGAEPRDRRGHRGPAGPRRAERPADLPEVGGGRAGGAGAGPCPGRRRPRGEDRCRRSEGAGRGRDQAIERFGRLDVLVNNAGVYETASLLEATDEQFERAFAVNVRATFLAARAAARVLPSGGRIINIGSILGERVPLPRVGIYSATNSPSMASPGPGRATSGPRASRSTPSSPDRSTPI